MWCVRERESERYRYTLLSAVSNYHTTCNTMWISMLASRQLNCQRVSECVCVCVCVQTLSSFPTLIIIPIYTYSSSFPAFIIIHVNVYMCMYVHRVVALFVHTVWKYQG